ncbi:MAG: bifunctional metallophosphatase/5'-nucleotidase, partial [Bacteroidia bacterium]
MSNNRREFLKKISAIGGLGLIANGPAKAAVSLFEDSLDSENANEKKESFQISILQTTDVHCQIHPHDELFWNDDRPDFRQTGGYAHLATYLKKERKKNPNTFLIDTGDMFQGSALSVKTTGRAMSPILNALNYDLYLPGNWEVIYGKKAMQTLLGGLQAPKICANMYHDLGEGKRGELIFQPYYIWHIQGVKIGFLGYTDPLVPIRQSPAYSKGIIYTKPEENLAHYVDVLKNQEQCDYIIMLAHLGLSQQIHLANLPACEGVNYIFGGDTHERVRTPIQCAFSKVVEPGAFGSFVGKLELTVTQGKITADSYSLEEISSKKHKADKNIAAIIKENESPFLEEIETIVGYSTLPLFRYFVVENPIDTIIMDALKWKLNTVDIVLSNGFRFCPPRSTPDHTGNIPITKGYIYDMLPVDSPIRTGTATGAQIKEWLEKELNNVFAKEASERLGGWMVKFKGMQLKFYAFNENGKRVESVEINGSPLELDKEYSISACEREGDPMDMICRMRGVKNVSRAADTLHSILLEYLKANSPVTPTLPKNA